ncbi:superinfection immunity protein [Helicobacter jaachi]|uniref:Superinfection immunity protein n=2 Tax=Helicobacter jaachi TaxID=1677920 RepID=A0A4U8TEQ6_9HELI|nr:superinfection immunity protein [Helicobacter jaachi]
MLPTFIALVRKHPNVIIIGLLNFFLGWSVICWFVCLIWCFIGSKS